MSEEARRIAPGQQGGWGSLHLWLRTQPLATDAILAGGLAVVAFLGGVAAPPEYMPIRDPALLAGWSLLGVIPIVIRRRWIRTALLLTLGLCAVAMLGQWSGSETYSLIVLTYTIAAYWPLARALLTALVTWGAIVALYLMVDPTGAARRAPWLDSPAILLFSNGLVLVLTFLIGRLARTRRMYEADLRERTRVAETTQQALTDQAVADERRRIARELHDVVAHHVSVMGILAAGVRRSMGTDPAAADAALSTIEKTGRTTLRELRRLLDIMRTDDDHADLMPQPGLAAVEALIEQLREETGMSVRLEVGGEPYDLDSGVALTTYRIVQEALTNTLKHAGRATAHVRLTFAEDRLEVEAVDDGRGPAIHPNRAGHGLVGIRERVALYGGQLRSGPRAGGGFRIAATIPIERPSSVPECE